MTATMPAPTVEDRLDQMAAQLDELTAEIRWQRRQRETATELLSDLSGLTGASMDTIMAKFAELEAAGHIDFARASMGVVDRVMTSFSEEDVDALGDNVVLILQTVKEMTQPEIMTMLQRTAHAVNEDSHDGDTPSTLHLLRELRQPEVRRGMHRLLGMLRSMGEDRAAHRPAAPSDDPPTET